MITKEPSINEILNDMVSTYLTSSYPIARDSLLTSIRRAMVMHNLFWLDCDGFAIELKKEGIKWHSEAITVDGCCPKCGTREHQIMYVYGADTDNEKHVVGCKNGHVFKVLYGWAL